MRSTSCRHRKVERISPETFLIVYGTITFLIAGTVKGAIGIGMPTAAIGLLTQVIDPKTAVALVVFPTFLSNAWQMIRAGETLRAIKDYWIFAATLIVVLWFTTSLTASVSQEGLLLIIGSVVVAFSLTSLLFSPPRLPDQWDRPAQALGGAVAGVIGGLTSVWAAPIVIYLVSRRTPPDEFIRATGVLITIGAVPLVLGFWYNGIFDTQNVWLSLFLVIPALIGFALGERARKHLPTEKFQPVVLVVFLVMGVEYHSTGCVLISAARGPTLRTMAQLLPVCGKELLGVAGICRCRALFESALFCRFGVAFHWWA